MAGTVGHVILTGAKGYIARRVAQKARARGLRVTMLSREAPGGWRHCAWSLGEGLPAGALDERPAAEQAVIHLAHDWKNSGAEAGNEGGLNEAGTRALLEGCRAAGLGRFVFVSSQSAREDAANIYGRTKARIERLLDRPGEVSARVGLVYGGPKQAMFGLLCRLTGLSPVLPMIDPWRGVQPVHVDEVADGLLLLAERGGEGWVGLASPEPLPFGEFLRILAREFHGVRLRILPVPLRLALLACDVSARLPLFPTVDKERVLGLAGTRRLECGAQLAALGLRVAPFAEGLRGEPGCRRALLREGCTLLRYVLGARPTLAMARRYARSVTVAGEGPLALPWSVHGLPGLLRLGEPVGGDSALACRLRLASTVVELSPQGEQALAAGSRGFRLLGLAWRGALDALCLPVRTLRRS